ncbi:MAG: LysR family transcriptional regulator [Proteobacteria bacterium]|nr:MAG: LysR family transcriptional regulator [Pseudomonadota bacterium]
MASPSNEMVIFQRVVERGSFAGAAEDIGLSPSAVAKLISRLEARLGVRLINRTTRRLALTAEGEIYHEHAREILAAIEAAEADIASARLSPRGHLRIHAFPVIAVHHLVPVLPDFLRRYPQISFDFLVTNRIVDIVGENVDVSLRMGALNDSALVARKIVDLRRIVCASPSYLARHGRPSSPADLVHHSCLSLSRNPGAATWPFRVGGELVQVEVKGAVSADSADMLLGLAIQGAGILRLSEHVVAEAIAKGELEPLLQDVQDPEQYPLWALLPSGRHQAPKVKAFLDFLIGRLGSAPWRARSESVQGGKSRRSPVRHRGR